MIKHFKEGNRVENNISKSRPTKLTKHDKGFIIRKIVNNPRSSTPKVTAEFHEKFSTSISLETVRRILRAVGINGRSALRKMFVSKKLQARDANDLTTDYELPLILQMKA